MIVKMNSRKLCDILSCPESLNWQDAIYLPKDEKKWSLSCDVIIENPENFEAYDDNDNPIEISNINYRYVLLCDDLASIIFNLREQTNLFELDMAYTAFIYYFENDSFIKLSQ
ncbi:hypothetical protein F0170_03395 [Pseudomonas sp. MAFF 730085]|uniref:DUF7716 domain-containing protein n=1 Tax=Pseudomonas kitaguniensis TaxID=2607908 RepID=A0A5N7JP75_9PSED|nr:hypothetical protein [Pseudomonas kitaguniensis]